MIVSTRAIAAVGLGALGLAFLAGPTRGQQQQDPAVRKTTSQGATAKPQPPSPATVGSVDMGAVFKGYDKVKVNSEEFKAAVMARKGELMKLQSEAEQEAQKMSKFTPGSLDFKKVEDRITQLKAEHEAKREQCEREFTLRESEMLATLYKEVQVMVARIAEYKGMTYVVRVSNDPVVGSNPNSAMMAIERTVVYSDPRNDITNDVVHNLNLAYKAAGGPPPKPATNAPGAAGAGGGAGAGGARTTPPGN